MPTPTLREDFDRIARALDAAGVRDALSAHERALLDFVPASVDRALDVGCGDGALTRCVARRARSVLALDLSPEMIRLAEAHAGAHTNIEFRVADITTTDLPADAFDVVLSVATLHHVPLEPTVRRLATAVRPGGLLLVQDLVHRPGFRYLPQNALAWLARRTPGVRGRQPGVVAALYEAHGRDERYLTPDEVSRAYARLLPGARVVQHLFWRYTVAWRRPSAAR